MKNIEWHYVAKNVNSPVEHLMHTTVFNQTFERGGVKWLFKFSFDWLQMSVSQWFCVLNSIDGYFSISVTFITLIGRKLTSVFIVSMEILSYL